MSRIVFDSIPASTRKPGQYGEFNKRLAVNSLPANVQKVLVVGQIMTAATAWVANTVTAVGKIIKPTTLNGHIYFCVTAGTTATPTEPTWPITQGGEVTDGTVVWKEFHSDTALATVLTEKQIFSDADAKDYFGNGSMLHLMARAALKANPYTNLYAISCADGAGVHASGTVTISGSPVGSGSIKLWIGEDMVEAAFVSTDSATVIATALQAAIAAKPDLPVVAQRTAAVLTLIYKHKGTQGNSLSVTETHTVTGSLAVAIVAMANGTVDPDLHAASGVLDTIYPTRYHKIASAYNDATSLGYLKTHIENVSGSLEQRPGIVVAAFVGAIASAQTLADGLNHERHLLATVKGNIRQPLCIAAAIAAALTKHENPATPFDGEQIATMPAITGANRYSRSEQETLLLHGLTPLDNGDGDVVEIVRAVSTYQTDASMLDITTITSLDYFREAANARYRARFQQRHANQKTADAVLSECLCVAKQLEDEEILQDIDANKDGFEIEIATGGRFNLKVPTPVVPGLHIIASRYDLILV